MILYIPVAWFTLRHKHKHKPKHKHKHKQCKPGATLISISISIGIGIGIGIGISISIRKRNHLHFLKPNSHLCDKNNTSEISISISTMQKKLISLVLCLSHKCEPGFMLMLTSLK